jgi:hypothetical protein
MLCLGGPLWGCISDLYCNNLWWFARPVRWPCSGRVDPRYDVDDRRNHRTIRGNRPGIRLLRCVRGTCRRAARLHCWRDCLRPVDDASHPCRLSRNRDRTRTPFLTCELVRRVCVFTHSFAKEYVTYWSIRSRRESAELDGADAAGCCVKLARCRVM